MRTNRKYLRRRAHALRLDTRRPADSPRLSTKRHFERQERKKARRERESLELATRS